MSNAKVEVQNLVKACNEALILAMLADGPKHGYQLAFEIETRGDGFFRFKHGTLYPILHKLEQQGLIAGTWSEEGPRGKRKSYGLTGKGRRYAHEQRAKWRTFIGHFLTVIGEEEV